MRSYKQVNEHPLAMISKKDGKVTGNSRVVVAADGKSRTFTMNGSDSPLMAIFRPAISIALNNRTAITSRV
jgi:hypothetical protein